MIEVGDGSAPGAQSGLVAYVRRSVEALMTALLLLSSLPAQAGICPAAPGSTGSADGDGDGDVDGDGNCTSSTRG